MHYKKLTEERHIADEVTRATTSICQKIDNCIKETPIINPINSYMYQTEHIFYHRFTFDENINNERFVINLRIIRFENGCEEDWDNSAVRTIVQKTLNHSESIIGMRMINLNFPMNQQGLDWYKIQTTVQHEVEHCYEATQIIKKNIMPSKKWRMFYNAGIGMLNSKDKVEKAIGTIIYRASKGECDAVLNAYYRAMTSIVSYQTIKDVAEYDKNSLITQEIQRLKNAINIVEKCDKEKTKQILIQNNINYSMGDILTYGRKGVKYFEKRRLAIYQKALDDATPMPIEEDIDFDKYLNKKS